MRPRASVPDPPFSSAPRKGRLPQDFGSLTGSAVFRSTFISEREEPMATDATDTLAPVQREEEKRVIFASSLGTVFEWYDFYLYATLAPFFAALFFPPGNATAALLSAFVTYAAGFLVRPFGALFFGRIGDLVGRKYTFLITIVFMGGSTFLVGCLPTYESIGSL